MTDNVKDLIDKAKAIHGEFAYLGRQEFCPKCQKMVRTIRGIKPKCSECGTDTQPTV